MLRNPNRFLVKQVESARRRGVRAESHADRMELQRLRAQTGALDTAREEVRDGSEEQVAS